MTLAVMTCPAFTFSEFKEEFRATGRIVPAGIVLSANNSAANMIRQIHHMRFMEMTSQIMSSSASYRIYDGSTSKPHAVKRSMGTHFCPRLVRTHSLSSSERSYCAGERPILLHQLIKRCCSPARCRHNAVGTPASLDKSF